MAERPPAGESDRRKAKEEEPANGRKTAPPPPVSSVPTRRSVPPPAPSSGKAVSTEDPRHPSIPPLPAAGPWRSYKEIVAGLATRIVEAQRPIRVLQALRWDNSIEEQFRKSRCRDMPKIDADYYEKQDLGFDPRTKATEFEEIAKDVDRELGE